MNGPVLVSIILVFFLALYPDAFTEQEDADAVGDPSPSSSLAAEEEVERYLLHGDPRMLRLSDLPDELCGPGKPYFNERSAAARKSIGKSWSILRRSVLMFCPNLVLIADVLAASQRRDYDGL
jgi:hypothetical protein